MHGLRFVPPARWPRLLRGLLWPLQQLYKGWVVLRASAYHRGWLASRRLPCKVVSVGNMTVGGTGKTPMVLFLAAGLSARGFRPAVLTRGYGRRVRTPMVISDRGDLSRYTSEVVGDEPLVLLRRFPGLTIGVGGNRGAVAHHLLEGEAVAPTVLLLDDGFQHLQLARDLDIILLDATNPFGGQALLPAGRLREPLPALGRAQIVVITRVPGGMATEAPPSPIVETLRRYNPEAPVFLSRTRLAALCDAATHRPADRAELERYPVLAFCGIGNPDAFFADLDRWGFQVAGTSVFPDHYRYGVRDFKAIIQQADRARARWLVTTEKDAANLTVIPPSRPPCYYVQIDLEVDGEESFFALVLSRLGARS